MTTQRDVDPFVEPNVDVYEGAWVYDETHTPTKYRFVEYADMRDDDLPTEVVPVPQPFVVTKIVNGYARLEKDPWSPVRAVRTGHLTLIERNKR